jgi:hypothetical protein
MTSDDRNWGLILDVLHVLECHGYHEHDGQHTDQAIGMISGLAHIYEGSQDHPFGPNTGEIPPRTEPASPGPASQDAVVVPAEQVKTLLIALDIAADHQRDGAELCADCIDQSCPSCESRLQDARAYDHLAAQFDQTVQARRTATASDPGPAGQPQPTADREAGQ